MSNENDALLQEIQRLTGAIDRHKNATTKTYRPYPPPSFANKKYVNPTIASKPTDSRSTVISSVSGSAPSSSSQGAIKQPRAVVIDGVTFESSHRKLTRLDSAPDSSGTRRKPISRTQVPTQVPKGNDLKPVRKPRFSKRKVLGGRNNLVLDNVKGTRKGKSPKAKRQCRFFTMTGECQRGRTCRYQHDPEKIAICPLFLSNSCPNTAENCRLSHDPTPSRVPLCFHFSNHGRCTRESCPYPHIRVGPRTGVCRNFAVVGYCDKGIDCDKQHVRECPDFAEKGSCPNKSCKLPHVIRANMRRKLATVTHPAVNQPPPRNMDTLADVGGAGHSGNSKGMGEISSASTVEGTGPAEEFISLTFEESEEESEDDEGSDDEDRSASEEDVAIMDVEQ